MRRSEKDALLFKCLVASHGNPRLALELFRRKSGVPVSWDWLQGALQRHPEWDREIALRLRAELRHLALMGLRKNLLEGRERSVLVTLQALAQDLGFGVSGVERENATVEGVSGGMMREVLAALRPEDVSLLREVVGRAAGSLGGARVLEGRVENRREVKVVGGGRGEGE